jgi:ABC-2 type transport system permease protein
VSAALAALREQAVRALRDPGALLILVGGVLIYAFFYPIPYLPEILKKVPVAVVDLDRSPLSRRLVRMAEADELVSVTRRAADPAAAEALVRAGEVGGVLLIPEGFERDVRRGGRATVVAYLDASYFLVYRQLLTGVSEAVGTLSAGVEIARLEAQGMSPAHARAERDPLRLVMRPLFNPTEGYATYVVPAVLVVILQQTLLIGIGLLGGTRRETGRPPTDGGVGPLAGVLGQATFFVGLYALHAAFYFTVVFRSFHFAQRGGWITLAVFTLPFLLSVTLLGLAAGGLFTRRETALQALLFTSLPAVFVAGFAWPAEAIPAWLRAAALLLPSTTAMAGVLRVTQMGASLAEVRAEWMTLWGLSALYLVLAWFVYRRRWRAAGAS